MDIIEQLKQIKPRYADEGFEILGVFGSVAREETVTSSDIDLLYTLDASFMEKNRGFVAFGRIDQIRVELQEIFQRKVDLVARSGLSRTGRKYILEEMVYV